MQPVLQWGNNGLFGGNHWTFASWHVYTNNGGGGYYSPTHTAATGDYISGDTWAENCNATSGICHWHIQTFWLNAAQTTTYSTQMNLYPNAPSEPNSVAEKFNRADMGVLENYNLTSCNQYPSDGSIQFQSTYLYQPVPGNVAANQEVWSAHNWSENVASGTTCGQDASVFNRSVYIDY